MRHRLSEVDPEARRGVCSVCGPTRLKYRGGNTWRCWTKHLEINQEYDRQRDAKRKNPYRVHKGPVCERCGFVPEHQCQLDVDHIDGNHQNNDPDNLQTLCANCHRIKSCEERAVRTRCEGAS